MRLHLLALLYGGPDQLMPLTSGLAAVFALVLVFGQGTSWFWQASYFPKAQSRK